MSSEGMKLQCEEIVCVMVSRQSLGEEPGHSSVTQSGVIFGEVGTLKEPLTQLVGFMQEVFYICLLCEESCQ